MRTWWFLLFSLLYTCRVLSVHSKNCENNSAEIECNATEYQSYVDCIRSRIKRSADCYEDDEEDCSSNDCGNSCDNCNCDECTWKSCGKSCNNRCCSNCCEFKECSTNHCCHKVCHNSCRTSSCRSSCRKSCYNTVRKSGGSSSSSTNSVNISSNSSNLSSNKNAHNITTVIHLNNVINNTNVIDVPINLENSNYNNITVESSQNSSSANGGTASGLKSQCCNVIEPRQCVQKPVYPFIDCFHIRRQDCGPFCKAPVVHKVAQNVCYNTQEQKQTCGQQVIYVPEPQSSCGYQPQWPYITCTNQGGNCNGCYDYLLNPYRTQTTCGSFCYSYGVNQGMMFRQGPLLGPGYSLPPPPGNLMMPPGCSGYSGCGLTNMASFINPSMYYGMNPYDNYGIYGSFNPNYMPNMVYGAPMMGGLQLGNYGNPFTLPLPSEPFVVMNFTANSNSSLYRILTNASSNIGGLPGVYNPPITIDEETFKKLLGQSNVQKKGEEEKVASTSVPTTTTDATTPTTTQSSSFFGR